MNEDTRVVIADFGLCVFVEAASNEFESTRAGNRRFLAPEMSLGYGQYESNLGTEDETYGVPVSLVSPSGRPTPQSDLFAFAMLCVQVRNMKQMYTTFSSRLCLSDLHQEPSVLGTK